MSDVVIVAAKRTPQGKFLGALKDCSAVDLAIAAGSALLGELGNAPIDQVIIGNVLAAGLGMNIARQIGIGLNLPTDVPAYTVNMMCASGMQAVILGSQAIRAGQARVVLCGGTESMSNAPFLVARDPETNRPLDDESPTDVLLRDGLIDTFDGRHMALTAEDLAQRYGISRPAQDEFALLSQQRYVAAKSQGVFDREIASLPELAADEHPRGNVTLEKLASLRTSFHSEGTITAGNASGINDGAAMVVVCDVETAKRRGWTPLATLASSSSVGCDPAWMGLGPVHAIRRLCDECSATPNDFDMIEINEAFAAQSLACLAELGLSADQVNVNGGAIAIGHPIGASGARLIVHAAHQLSCGRARRALVSLCVGGGMGVAVELRAIR